MTWSVAKVPLVLSMLVTSTFISPVHTLLSSSRLRYLNFPWGILQSSICLKLSMYRSGFWQEIEESLIKNLFVKLWTRFRKRPSNSRKLLALPDLWGKERKRLQEERKRERARELYGEGCLIDSGT